jgi:hypothetical protein
LFTPEGGLLSHDADGPFGGVGASAGESLDQGSP